tara:strand:- start:161 stop:1231 length:1071 start_codon:yes stop_codon:yes gene_type:complete
MYINRDKVTLLHVEPTSKCNASCPGCPRNNDGFGVVKGLVLQDLDPDIIIARAKELPNLQSIHLCGNIGDPIAYKYLNKLIDKVVAQNEFFLIKSNIHWSVGLATNGSLRSVKWWQELGKKLHVRLWKSHTVTFGIDGLVDTSPIYRQGTNFNKVMDNAKAFIDEGGIAEWQYLKFKHNEHQVEEAKQLAESIGFKRFFIQQPYLSPAYHWKTGERYYLEPATNLDFDVDRNDDFSTQWSKYFATPEEKEAHKNAPKGEGWRYGEYKPGYGEWENDSFTTNNYVENNNCMHMDIDGDGSYNYSLFLTVAGKVLPCCYFDLVGVDREKFDMKTLDIKNEFDNNTHRLTCRRLCGSIK